MKEKTVARKMWQVPISVQLPTGRGTAHWFERTRSRNRQVAAACGMIVTPGLAQLAEPGAPQCQRCAKEVLRINLQKEERS